MDVQLQCLRHGDLCGHCTPHILDLAKDCEDDQQLEDRSKLCQTSSGLNPSLRITQSPEPLQHRTEDDDLPSLSNGYSMSRASSMMTDGSYLNTLARINQISRAGTPTQVTAGLSCGTHNSAHRCSSKCSDSANSDFSNSNDLVRPSPLQAIKSPENDMEHAAAHLNGTDDFDDVDDVNEETDEEDDESNGSNDSWNLQIHFLETAVLRAFRGNVDLAAFLLANLGEILGLQNSRDISKDKVTSWIPGIKFSPNSSETTSGQTQSSESSYNSQATKSSTSNDRKGKRQRSSDRNGQGRSDERDNDDEDQGERHPKKAKEDDGIDEQVDLLLACPFWKLDPDKYNAHYRSGVDGTRRSKYRTCEGAGFPDIQRLKEHLKRVHIHMQCPRCGAIFDGSDSATRERRFEEHHRQQIPCQLGEVIKEGISEGQLTALGRSSNKKGKSISCPLPKNNVEKWNEIWNVLFPNRPCPPHPWRLLKTVENDLSFSGESLIGIYRKFFESGLRHMVNTQYLQLDDLFLSQVVDLALRTFALVTSPSIQDLSLGSSSSFQLLSDHSSYLGGPFQSLPLTGHMGFEDPSPNPEQRHVSNDRRPSPPNIMHNQHPRISTMTRASIGEFPPTFNQSLLPLHTVEASMHQFSDFPSSSAELPGVYGQYQFYGSEPSLQNSENVGFSSGSEIQFSTNLPPFNHGSDTNTSQQSAYSSSTTIAPPTTAHYNTPQDFRRSPLIQPR